MKLYYTPGVCSLAPHIILREAGFDFSLEKVNADTKVTDAGRNYLTVNPNGYVPALEIEPGVVLTEGPAIMQYLADQAPEARLAPAAGTLARYQLQSWLNFITSELHKGFSPLFKPGMPAEAKTAFKEQLAARFDHVERHLSKQDYLMPDGFSIADAYLFVVTGWSGFVGIDMQAWPAIGAFRKRVEARPAVQAALIGEGLLKKAA
ncbi:MAG TPA: glutathione transferase GstA [Noviherbaspirillum sp.]|jgi:glutathione S-transferase|uniref:glutathione transferase GstA n=1 Tax=Noviherbaspirillum sp. TaxID=1926288 RepID=UPI002DDCFD24|nr:glutathione transferase GstA [Noviherbaspirillum sp.]HEV2610199.1 glutathione transferase GstA [Noviherbaspirillum sp.]